MVRVISRLMNPEALDIKSIRPLGSGELTHVASVDISNPPTELYVGDSVDCVDDSEAEAVVWLFNINRHSCIFISLRETLDLLRTPEHTSPTD